MFVIVYNNRGVCCTSIQRIPYHTRSLVSCACARTTGVPCILSADLGWHSRKALFPAHIHAFCQQTWAAAALMPSFRHSYTHAQALLSFASGPGTAIYLFPQTSRRVMATPWCTACLLDSPGAACLALIRDQLLHTLRCSLLFQFIFHRFLG